MIFLQSISNALLLQI